jgi:hypothetical protein
MEIIPGVSQLKYIHLIKLYGNNGINTDKRAGFHNSIQYKKNIIMKIRNAKLELEILAYKTNHLLLTMGAKVLIFFYCRMGIFSYKSIV